MIDRLLTVLLFIGSILLYLSGMASTITAGDCGEFVTAAATLSLAHAPSYPLYSIAARFVIELFPFGGIAYRTNFFSVLCAAGALTVLYRSLRLLKVRTALALLIVGLAGLSKSFWTNALVTEVFSLHLFLA